MEQFVTTFQIWCDKNTIIQFKQFENNIWSNLFKIFDKICKQESKIREKERFAFYGKNLQKEMRILTPGCLPRFDFPWLGANEKEQKYFLPKFASIQTNSPQRQNQASNTKERHFENFDKLKEHILQRSSHKRHDKLRKPIRLTM